MQATRGDVVTIDQAMRLKPLENGREATEAQIAVVHSVFRKLQEYSLLIVFKSHGFNWWLEIRGKRLARPRS